MTLHPARDLFADAQSFPSLFNDDLVSSDRSTAEPGDASPEPAVASPDPAVSSVVAAAAGGRAVGASESAAADAAVTAETDPAQAESRVTFDDLGLPRRIVDTLRRDGITTAFPIQAATIPDAIRGRDVLGRGQTGSGKTLAFGLPVIVRLAAAGKAAPGHPAALILVPTRELAMQVNDAIAPLARTVGLFSRTAFGGMPYDKQIRDLRRGVDILVATPGRLGDLIQRGECSLDDIEITVLDEADQMADMGFLPDVTALLEKTPRTGQRLLFSATLDGDVDTLVRRFMHDAVTHSVDPPAAAVSTMDHQLLLISPREKTDIVASIGARSGRTIMFVRTQMAVDRLTEQLTAVGVRAAALHGGKTQRVRTRTLAEFREGKVNVLVATDVAARGIHVDGVSLVVHIDPPKDAKDYLHRAGRTARAGEAGTVATLVMPRQRKPTYAMLERAGVTPGRSEVRLGAPELAELTGAREPSGVPVVFNEPSTVRDRRDKPTARGDRPHRDRPYGDRPRHRDGVMHGGQGPGSARNADRPEPRTEGSRGAAGERPYRGLRDERGTHRAHDTRATGRGHDARGARRGGRDDHRPFAGTDDRRHYRSDDRRQGFDRRPHRP